MNETAAETEGACPERSEGARVPRLGAAVLGGLGTIGVGAVGVVLLVWGQAILVAAIVFSVKTLGLWLGYAVFTAGWAVLGLASLAIYDRVLPVVYPVLMRWWRQVWPPSTGSGQASRMGARKVSRMRPEVLIRLATRAAAVSHPLGVLVAAALVGGPGTPVWRLLGYRGARGYVCVVVSAVFYAAIWVPFYGAGGVALWRFAGDKLF